MVQSCSAIARAYMHIFVPRGELNLCTCTQHHVISISMVPTVLQKLESEPAKICWQLEVLVRLP